MRFFSRFKQLIVNPKVSIESVIQLEKTPSCLYICIYCGCHPSHCNGDHRSNCAKFIPHVVTCPQEIKDMYTVREIDKPTYCYKICLMKDGHRRTVKMYDTSLAGLSRKLSLKYNLNSEDVYRRYVRVLEIKRIE